MIAIVCTGCAHCLHVVGDVSEVDQLVGQRSDFWPDKYPCWNCGSQAQGFLSPEISAAAMEKLQIFHLTPQEAFAALMGMGLPEERKCCAEVVEALLQGVGLKVKGKEFRGLDRYFIDQIELADGTKLFLGSSPQGACVYRITKPHSYTKANDVG